MPSRYQTDRKIVNNTDYYEPLRKSRDAKRIVQYSTKRLRNPTVQDRRRITTDKHIWSYGDRLYNLAHKYYGDSRYWWVIAWWNSYPTEAKIDLGTVLYVPLNLEAALDALGV
tara:strand:- start:359 stop:697 length:339 start_codon:yes stop_codon:yes gene_type:complete